MVVRLCHASDCGPTFAARSWISVHSYPTFPAAQRNASKRAVSNYQEPVKPRGEWVAVLQGAGTEQPQGRFCD